MQSIPRKSINTYKYLMMNEPTGFTGEEKKLIGKIASIFAIRQLSISLLMPFVSIYIMSMDGATKTLAGLAFGIFSVSQTLLQIPMGNLSDRWGRKQTTLLGLSLYGIGTLLSGFSFNIYHLILARMITGCGAVKGVILAWLTDGIPNDKRNSALSYVGIAIGAVAIFGFSINALIAGNIGIEYLFYISALLIFILIIYIAFDLKNFELKDNVKIDLKKENIMRILRNSDILRIYILGFTEHFCYASTFFILPILIKKTMAIHAMWKINAPMGIIGTCFMFYFARKADRSGTIHSLKIAIIFGIIGSFIAIQFNNIYSLAAAFIIIYSAHCILQAILPAVVSKYPMTQVKGTAMGIYITFEAIGASCGGLAGGWLQDHHRYCFWMLILLFAAAFIIISGFKDFKAEPKNV